MDLSRQRCYNHAVREAVARCPECGRYYCRECVTEHDDRVLCSACLARLAGAGGPGQRSRTALALLGQFALGLLLLWLFFVVLGKGLLALPSSFHEGTVWRPGWHRP